MRILAIRGKHLTSLEGAFELDLEHGPLGSAGIFAIAGPTGAGKSTLLDALCVALYNKTPRLKGQGGVEVGREGVMRGIPASDPRNLLRDGAGEGHAEVDFVGRDGRRWRARWSVWRARRRPDGTFQPVELTLEEIDGARVGGKLTETLAAIEERIGLDFEQFKRAVLLAQGDFAAFLKAERNDRAALLEQLTGTTIYGEISKRAYDRAARETEALRLLEAELAGAQPLSDEARAAAQAEVDGTTAARAAARAAAERLRSARAWHGTAERLAADLARARAEVETATSARAALDAERALLAAIDAAEPARPAVEALDAAAAAAARATQAEAERASVALRAADAARTAAVALHEAAAARAAAEAHLAEAGPALAAARAIDARLRDAARRADEAVHSAGAAVRRAEEASRVATDLDATRGALDARRAELDAWLAKEARTAGVAARWGEVRLHLARHVEAAHRRAAAAEAVPAAAGALDTARARERTAKAAAEARRAAAAAAGRVAAHAQAAAEAAADEGRPVRRAVLTQRRAALARCGEVVARAARVDAEREAERAAVAEATRGAAAAAEEAEAHANTATQRGAALTEARDNLRRAQAALDLTSHRTRLRPGEHCPLCGATEHPWADGSPLADLLADQTGRVAALERELADASAAAAAACARRDAARDAAARGDERLAARDAERATLAVAWAETRVEPLPATLPDGDTTEAEAGSGPTAGPLFALAPTANSPLHALSERVTALLADTDAELVKLDAAEQAHARAGQAAREALAAQRDAEAALADAVAAHTTATRAREAAERAAQENTRALTEATDAVRAALADAAPAFPDDKWRDNATADPAKFLRDCEGAVARYTERLEAQAKAGEEAQALHLRQVEAKTAADAARVAAAEARAASEARTAERAELTAERAGLLDGADADTVERGLTHAARAAREAEERARAAAEHRAAEAASAEAAARAAAEDRARRDAERDAARAALDRALAELALDEPALRGHLGRDRRWRDTLRRRIEEAERAVADATARAAERARARDEHAATEAPAEDRATVEAGLPEAERALTETDEAWSRARATLLQDDDRRARAAALLPKLDAQRAVTERWRVLGRLLGSREGTSFRKFAQSLTLNLLVVESNAQLSALNPRYRLERVPNEEMELQVADLHMAEQVRPLTSLSGGETFLVSLALALGLASLASTRTRVESIFVDEGFGTLDADTLDVALATLEGLRAEGRTVGVISHVGGLAERLGTWVSVEKVGAGRSRVRIEQV